VKSSEERAVLPAGRVVKTAKPPGRQTAETVKLLAIAHAREGIRDQPPLSYEDAIH
jgi:hypothetical protein